VTSFGNKHAKEEENAAADTTLFPDAKEREQIEH